jgi:tetratricopeptide (TPR) repeat protein
MAGSRSDSSRLLELAQPIAEAAADEDPLLLGMLGQALAFRAHHTGDHGAALAGTRACIDAFTRAGDQRAALVQRANLASVEIEIGLYEDAERTLITCLETAERGKTRDMVAFVRHALGQLCLHTGRLDEAATHLEVSRAESGGSGDPWLVGLSGHFMAQIQMRRGALDDARKEAERALATLRGGVGHAPALTTVASVWLACGEREEALRLAAEASALVASEGGSGSTDGDCRLVHARALHACGRAAEAHEMLARTLDGLAQRAMRLGEERLRTAFLRSYIVSEALALADAWGLEADARQLRVV